MYGTMCKYFIFQKNQTQILLAKIRGNMRSILVITSFFAILCCKAENQMEELLVFRINDGLDSIGFIKYEDAESIGPRAILLYNARIFLPDPVYGNIKVIDIRDGSLGMSRVLFPNQSGFSWLDDITFCNGKIWVSSFRDSIFVFDESLEVVTSISTDRGGKIFLTRESDTCEVLNWSTKVISEYYLSNDTYKKNDSEGILLYDFYKYSKGRRYQVKEGEESDQVVTDFGWVDLNRKYRSLSKYYDGYNIDFDESRLVYFELDLSNNEVLVFIYQFETGESIR